jgi:hypothetical protein
MQDRGDLHRGPLTTAGGSDTASIEASCNAAIAKKFLTDILANGPVVPFAPRANDPETTYSPRRDLSVLKFRAFRSRPRPGQPTGQHS